MNKARYSKRLIAVLCFFALSVSLVPPALSAEEIEKKDRTPEAYSAAEFPLWAHELRRFEILTFGALPLVTMLSFWTYDISRSIKHPGDQRYYPWPMKKPGVAVPLTSSEQKKIFFTAVGISVGIALTDICVRAIIRSVREKKMLRENLLHDDSIQLEPITEPDE